VAAGKASHLVAIAADGHGAPTAATRTRFVAEKKTASGVRANAQAGLRAFDNDFRRGTRDGGQEPVQSSLARLEFHFPSVFFEDDFVVALGDAQNLVDRLGPLARNQLLSDNRPKGLAQGVAKPNGAG